MPCNSIFTHVQRFCNEESAIENGIYLGQIAALQFAGPFDYKKVSRESLFRTTGTLSIFFPEKLLTSASLMLAEQALVRFHQAQAQTWAEVV